MTGTGGESPPDRIAALSRELISRANRHDADKTYGLYVFSGNSEFAPLARFVEGRVFTGRFGEDEEFLSGVYGAHELATTFLLVMDHVTPEPIGEIRLVQHSPLGYPSLVDIERAPAWGVGARDILSFHGLQQGEEHLVEISTLAVRDDAARRVPVETATTLFYALRYFVEALGTEGLFAIIDEVVASICQASGAPFVPVCDLPAAPYLGSPSSRPYLLNVPDMLVRIANRQVADGYHPETYDDCSLPPIDLRDAPEHPAFREFGTAEERAAFMATVTAPAPVASAVLR